MSDVNLIQRLDDQLSQIRSGIVEAQRRKTQSVDRLRMAQDEKKDRQARVDKMREEVRRLKAQGDAQKELDELQVEVEKKRKEVSVQ